MQRNISPTVKRILFGALILSALIMIIAPKQENPISSSPNSTVKNAQPVIKHSVTLTKNGFEPKELTINKDEVVIWTNNSGEDASVNSADFPTHKRHKFLNLGLFSNNSSLQAQITTVGLLEYVNALNPSQKGTIIVK